MLEANRIAIFEHARLCQATTGGVTPGQGRLDPEVGLGGTVVLYRPAQEVTPPVRGRVRPRVTQAERELGQVKAKVLRLHITAQQLGLRGGHRRHSGRQRFLIQG